ncbi:MAG: endonuclease domain-containing protein [Kineosporiaceae bacterium]
MREERRPPAALRGRVFLAAEALADGTLTPRQLRGGSWRRLLRGVYADLRLPVDHGLFCRGAMLVLPPGSVLSGRSAAWLWGGEYAAGPRDPVEACVPLGSGGRNRRGLVLRRVPVRAEHVTARDGLATMTPLRTAFEVGATHPVEVAVPVLDELLRLGVVDSGELPSFAASWAGRPGALRARRAFELADGGAESPPESLLRLALVRRGLSPHTQVRIRDPAGRVVARVDLGFPDERVAIEYDGSYHAEPGQFAQDRKRLNAIQAAGWIVVFVTAADLRDLDAVADKVVGLLARRRQTPL